MDAFCQCGNFAYFTETFTAGVIQSYQGQGTLEEAPLIQGQDPLEVFQKFDIDDMHPRRTTAKWVGKDLDHQNNECRFRLWKDVKDVFCIQIFEVQLTLGSLGIFILVLDFQAQDICYDRESNPHWRHQNSLPHKMADTTELFVVKMLPFLLIITMFGWRLVKKLNSLILNLLGAFLDILYLQVYGLH